MEADTVRLNFDFPRKHYPYVKLLCAEKNLTFREFATRLLIKELEEYEDSVLFKKAKDRLDKLDKSQNIAIEEAFKLAGWEECQKNTKSNSIKNTSKNLKKSRRKISKKSKIASEASPKIRGPMASKS